MFNIFPYIFSSTVNIVANNMDLIENIVDTVMNSEAVTNMIDKIDQMANPKIEMREHREAYIIDGYLPGTDKSNIKVDYNNNYITIEIKREFAYSNNNGSMSVAIVQQGGNIVEDFYVEGIDPYRIRAAFKDDKLRVFIPKIDYKNREATIIDVDEYTME